MDTSAELGFGTQIRRSPSFDATVRWGAQGFSVHNHTCIPRDFGDPERDFWNLVTDAVLCDVAVRRQVEATGPDADADSDTDPFALGLDRLVDLDTDAEFIGEAALRRIRDEAVSRRQAGLVIDGPRPPGQRPFVEPDKTLATGSRSG